MESMMQADIRDGLNRLGPGEPVALVVVSSDHVVFLDNWLAFLDRLNIDRIIIAAMDEALAARMQQGPFPVVRASFDGSAADFWRNRLRIWRQITEAGAAFIQSDTDAIWLSDPRPALSSLPGDLIFSQGTILPEEAVEAWGYVLCCGFFLARPTPATIALFEDLEERASKDRNFDDQVTLNRMLVADGTSWNRPREGVIPLDLRGMAFDTFRIPVNGTCQSRGLSLTLLPHHLFPRLQPNTPEAVVRHVFRGENASERIDLMREVGCWALNDVECLPQ